jgi:hypothetical protein
MGGGELIMTRPTNIGGFCVVVSDCVFARRLDPRMSAGVCGCVSGGLLSSYIGTFGVAVDAGTGLSLIELSGDLAA